MSGDRTKNRIGGKHRRDLAKRESVSNRVNERRGINTGKK